VQADYERYSAEWEQREGVSHDRDGTP